MEIILSVLIGAMTSAGIYLLLRRSIVKLILGIIFLSNAVNLLLFISSGLHKAAPPFVEKGKTAMELSASSDPLPQAMILTALVISFGFIAFTMILKYRYFQKTGTEDLDKVKETEEL